MAQDIKLAVGLFHTNAFLVFKYLSELPCPYFWSYRNARQFLCLCFHISPIFLSDHIEIHGIIHHEHTRPRSDLYQRQNS